MFDNLSPTCKRAFLNQRSEYN